MSRLALGTVQFGLAYGVSGMSHPVDPSETRRILEFARISGIERLDTAPAYGDIEERLRDLIADLDFSVVSKLPSCATESELEQSFKSSCGRLKPKLDGLLFHDPANLSGIEGVRIWSHAIKLADDYGLSLGSSYYDPAILASDVTRLPTIKMAQVPANAFDQRLLEAGELQGKLEVTIRSAFMQGLLLLDRQRATNRLPEASAVLTKWHQWCASRELSAVVAAFSIVKGMRPDFVVVGVDSLEQLKELVEAWNSSEPMVAPELAVSNPLIFDPRFWPTV
jgi:aryl-alcohol dehydrogenase-like predicted oxidoreductase